MRVLNQLKKGVKWILQSAVLLLAFALVLPLLPIIILGVGGSWIWRRVDTWRYRRGFEAQFRPEGKQLVFVYSNSPHWKDRIEQVILPRIRDKAVILNWSERSTEEWKRRPLEVRIFKHWGGEREFNPLAIVIPQEGPVQVIRFWLAYKDHKHGNPRLLTERERELFEALGLAAEEQPRVGAVQK